MQLGNEMLQYTSCYKYSLTLWLSNPSALGSMHLPENNRGIAKYTLNLKSCGENCKYNPPRWHNLIKV